MEIPQILKQLPCGRHTVGHMSGDWQFPESNFKVRPYEGQHQYTVQDVIAATKFERRLVGDETGLVPHAAKNIAMSGMWVVPHAANDYIMCEIFLFCIFTRNQNLEGHIPTIAHVVGQLHRGVAPTAELVLDAISLGKDFPDADWIVWPVVKRTEASSGTWPRSASRQSGRLTVRDVSLGTLQTQSIPSLG
jgi:hypothetical protein